MQKKIRPVWTWLPGDTLPIECGQLSWEPGLGSFEYAETYQNNPRAIALDPVTLGFSRSTKPYKETNWRGLFGVFRDAAPEGFGLDLLRHKYYGRELDEIDQMGLSAGDAVGAIEICTEEQLEQKLRFSPPSFEKLRSIMESSDPQLSSSRIIQSVCCADDGTSLGGEKPKLTICKRNAAGDNEWWIAKLPQRNGPLHIIEREFIAMQLAQACGLDAPESSIELFGEQKVFFVKRFDREIIDTRVSRRPFASAATVLRSKGLDPFDPSVTYPGLAIDMQRWSGNERSTCETSQQELWRRMAFNALVGNYDDHARNHGLLYSNGEWGLSPVYDIVAIPTYAGCLSMGVTPKGSRIASVDNLIQYAANFALAPQQAWEELQHMALTVTQKWREIAIEQSKLPDEFCDVIETAFAFANGVMTGVQAPTFDVQRARAQKPKSRG